jgi:hypothetical protein
MKTIATLSFACVLLFVGSTAHALEWENWNWQKWRDVLARLTGATACVELADPKLAAWCSELAAGAAAWIDQGVSIVVDRTYDEKDQQFANRTGITICYKDKKCISPKNN